MRSNSGCFVRVELTRFADELDVGCERRGVKNKPKVNPPAFRVLDVCCVYLTISTLG